MRAIVRFTPAARSKQRPETAGTRRAGAWYRQKRRPVALGALTPAIARAVPGAALRHNGRDKAENLPPALFSKPFMEVLGLAVGEGLVSMRRAATLLESGVDDFSDLFAVHGVVQPAEP